MCPLPRRGLAQQACLPSAALTPAEPDMPLELKLRSMQSSQSSFKHANPCEHAHSSSSSSSSYPPSRISLTPGFLIHCWVCSSAACTARGVRCEGANTCMLSRQYVWLHVRSQSGMVPAVHAYLNHRCVQPLALEAIVLEAGLVRQPLLIDLLI
eukprot:1161463-Pelagomonas_calceolata.AAC.11